MIEIENYVAIVDFGSQTTHLIGRRIRELGVEVKIIDPSDALKEIKNSKPAAIILSGGPASVYESGAPSVSKKLFEMGIPLLGICYGWQLTAHVLGGKVKPGNKEYGPTTLLIKSSSSLFHGIPDRSRVFESHGDTVTKLPPDFKVLGSTDRVVNAVVWNDKRNIYGVQFHPEMQHTKYGVQILKNFVTQVGNLAVKPTKFDVKSMIDEIKQIVGDKNVIGAISGGTDSSVAGTIAVKAIGTQFIPVYVDSGLMRAETINRIRHLYPKLWGVKVKVINARKRFLKVLKGIDDPETKRKTIGKLYIDIFEEEMMRYPKVKFLLQGTTYADFIHSQGSKRSAHIKSHHNVGGLPKEMRLKLLEPLRYYYTDEVRKIGLRLGLPKEMIFQQPYPGPGHAVRIVGEVTNKRLDQQVQADKIVVEELIKAGWYKKVFQSFSIMTGAMSTGVKGDSRFYGEVVALRCFQSKDRMTVDWTRLPAEVLANISARIVNEVPGVSRVVYDITTKPPATMEWE